MAPTVLLFVLFCANLSFGLPQSNCRSTPVPQDNRRISQKKCDEYKKIVAEEHYIATTIGSCSAKKVVQYKCNAFTGLIVGGEKTKTGEFPHMAAIGWKTFSGNIEFKCGGSLISERFVITAAHCINSRNGQPTVVRLGDQNLSNNNDGAHPKEYSIAQTIVPPIYNSKTKQHDLALIKLNKDVTFSEFIRPACLQENPDFGATVVATGWGKTDSYSQTSDELMKVVLKTVDRETCIEKIGDEVGEIFHSQICAGGEKNKDTCQGDSGGPIQVAHSDVPCVYNIVGMTSYGLSVCGSLAPSLYTRISTYLKSIEKIVWPNE